MLRKILQYGTIAGLIVGSVLSAFTIGMGDNLTNSGGMVFGYLTMLVGLSIIFIAIKKHRDVDLGGVIRFWPAFGLGLGISVVAGLFYVACWEAATAYSHIDFATVYSNMLLDEQKAAGASPEALAKLTSDMEQFKVQYNNPLFRLPMVFTEIFPVGVLVSLVSAGLLRDRRFLAVQRATASEAGAR